MDASSSSNLPEGSHGANRTIEVAPMLDITYSEFRYMMRLVTKRARLWTEMIVDNTLIHSDESKLRRLLGYDECEHPCVMQLGGSNPDLLAKASSLVETFGYDEINLNVGCPSDRVCGKGEFGASLMKKPELVEEKFHKENLKKVYKNIKIASNDKILHNFSTKCRPKSTSNFNFSYKLFIILNLFNFSSPEIPGS